MSGSTVRFAYDMWPPYNRRLRDVVGVMDAEGLAVRSSPDRWPIWAVVGHTADARVYWLCAVAGEPGAETTPFPPGAEDGWDHLDHPRDAGELVQALDTTFAIVEGCLDRWTPSDLAEPIERRYGATVQTHTRASTLQRLLTHEAYHCGELSQMLGIAGLPQIDLWRPD